MCFVEKKSRYKKNNRWHPPLVLNDRENQTHFTFPRNPSFPSHETHNNIKPESRNSEEAKSHVTAADTSYRTTTSAQNKHDEGEDLPETQNIETNTVTTKSLPPPKGSESSEMYATALQSQPNRGQTLSDLPDDVLLSVMDHMPAGDAVLLALTCRSFHTLVTTRKASVLQDLRYRTPCQDRLAFLRLLERDCRGHLLCTLCEKLHKRQSPVKELSFKEPPFRTKNECNAIQGRVNVGPYCRFDHSISALPECYVSRSMLDLVLRQVSLGEGYGIAIEKLRKGFDFKVKSVRPTQVKFSLDARSYPSAEGSLHLLVKTKFVLDVDVEKDVRGQQKAGGLQVCCHKQDGKPDTINKDLQRLLSGDQLVLKSGVECCQGCASSWEVKASRPDQKFLFPTVQMSVWKDLGPRGSHTNHIWQTQSDNSYDIFDRIAYVFRQASMKFLWKSAK